jgi:hypothetical protein
VSDAPEQRGAHAPRGVAEARRALAAWVDEAGETGREFLEARLLATGDGRYEVRHRHDRNRPPKSLNRSSDPFQAREIAQTTNGGDHRPLKAAPNLKQGWALVDLDAAGLWTAVDYLYPAAAMHWHAGRTGSLRVTHWRETAERQTGIYRPVRLLGDALLPDVVAACCADAVCLRRVAWDVDAGTFLAPPDEGPVAGDAAVPCPEACSIFISFARQVVEIERQPRHPAPGLGTLSEAEAEQVRAIVAGAAAGTLGGTREGEFDDPTNLRRIRYLAARLEREER